MSVYKHSWPRRSGKTGAAIMRALERGYKYYSCGFVTEYTRDLPFRADTLRGLKNVVADNYECATEEEKAILETMDNVIIFGTFGPDANDYKIVDSKMWGLILEDVERGIISMEFALREFNITA